MCSWLSVCGTLWVVWCTNTALGHAAADLEHCIPMDTLQCPVRSMPRRLRHGLRSTDTPAIDFFLTHVKMLERSSNFPEFAGRCLNAFTSHHSCLSPWPPSAVLSFLTSSPSDDTGPPIPTLQVQKGVTERSLAWTALPGHPSPRPECSNHRQG